MNSKNLESQSLKPTKKLRIRPSKRKKRDSKRSSSLFSRDSSVSNQTIITRQTMRTEQVRKTTERPILVSKRPRVCEDEIDNLMYSTSSRRIKNFNKTKNPLPKPIKVNNTITKMEDLETIEEVREELSNFIAHFKKTNWYFFLMSYKMIKILFLSLFKIILKPILNAFYITFTIFLKVLLLLIQIFIGLCIIIYFILSYFLPKRKYNPFINKMRYDYISWLDVIDDNSRFLFVNLESLAYITKEKPKGVKFTRFYLKDINGEKLNKIYLVPRPHLSEFLFEVS